MGQEILYCHSCGTKLLSDDFTRGRAHTFNNRQFCKTCVPTGMSPAMIPPPKPSPRPSTQRIQKEHRTPVRPITRVSAPPARRSSALLFFGLGIVVALGAAVGVLYALGAFNGVAPAPETPAPAPKPPEPRPDPTKAARQKEQFAAELKDLESKAKPSLDRVDVGSYFLPSSGRGRW